MHTRTGLQQRHLVLAFASAMAMMSSIVIAGPVQAASWNAAGDLALARVGHEATLLMDGRVLVTGGNTTVGNTYDTKLAEVYDPTTNTWSSTGSTTNGRSQGHTATRLADGKVLLTGGVNANVCTFDTTAELYDPTTGTWSFTGSLAAARYFATATRLADGRVLVAGGGNRCGAVFSSAEIYDPSTGTWSVTGSMTTPREFHDAIGLADGRVLVVGGHGPAPTFATQSSAEIYDPGTGTWTATGSMATSRAHTSLALLMDGRVMGTGGYSGAGNATSANGPDVEILDPATGTWSATGSLSVARSSGTLSVLSSGKVLAAGGTDGATTHASAELWDPAAGTWSATASLTDARSSHTSTVLFDGSVLLASGAGSDLLTSAERYREDDTPPTITITTPDHEASYLLGSTVLADYACMDEAGGSGLASCVGSVANGAAIDTSTVGPKSFTVEAEDNDGNASALTHDYTVVYDFGGFFAPMDNPPVFNLAKAGSAIPVKFGLDGDQGLAVFADGYPRSRSIACDTSAPIDGVEQTMMAGSSSLSYDPALDRYTFVWKTNKSWAGTCRRLEVGLDDGTVHTADLQFR